MKLDVKMNTPPRWLTWAREIQALAQTGYHYAEDEYDRERYQRLMEIAAEIIQDHTRLDYSSLLNIFQTQKGYATPRIDVRGAVFQSDVEQKSGKILLVRERADGRWTLPGGWADVGDVPSQAAEREVWEEAGFRVRAYRVIGIYDANRSGPLELFHAFKLVFLCDLIDGQPTPSNETSEVAFFGFNELPDDLSKERTRPRHLQDAFAAYANPGLPTVFD
jgi:8-oxo-dGTP pyrophosphatase MutT (NUDIX family)